VPSGTIRDTYFYLYVMLDVYKYERRPEERICGAAVAQYRELCGAKRLDLVALP
jgi:hypothetical protein